MNPPPALQLGGARRSRPDTHRFALVLHLGGPWARAAGTIALGLIPVVGPIIAAIAGPALGSLGYKAESDLISGLGASYKVYFGVVPA